MLLLALLLQTAPDTGAAIRGAIEQVAPAERPMLDSAYHAAGWQFLWHQRTQITPAGVALDEELRNAWSRGLDSLGYLPHLFNGFTLDSTAVRDVRLSYLALRMARDLSIGRIDPATLSRSWRLSDRSIDGMATLRRLREAASAAAVFDSLEPRDPGYWRLRRALPALRQLTERAPAWRSQGLPRTLRLGDTSVALPRLRQRLQLLGDLPADSELATGMVLDSMVTLAVRRFQARHGLEPDGVVGSATFEALATPLQWRVRQVELALERWRWFGDPGSAPLIEVDVANATLQLRDSLTGAERFAGRAIVGAPGTPTPLLESQLSRVLFNPAWVVPTTIARQELVPSFRADSVKFVHGNYELLRGTAVVPPTPENLAAVGRGVTLRQRPGPGNALGRIKFEVMGTTAVHLHDTPAPALFTREVRTLSHGCVRVDQPADLAIAVLGPEWNHDRIASATADTMLVSVIPPRRVSVRLMYATAAVDEDGTLWFRPDRYLRDRQLDAALQRGR